MPAAGRRRRLGAGPAHGERIAIPSRRSARKLRDSARGRWLGWRHGESDRGHESRCIPTETSHSSSCAPPRPPRSARCRSSGAARRRTPTARPSTRCARSSPPSTSTARSSSARARRTKRPMLFNGEHVGNGRGPQCDVAVDPIDGTSLTAAGRNNALSVIAVSDHGTMLDASTRLLHGQARHRSRRGGRRRHPPADRREHPPARQGARQARRRDRRVGAAPPAPRAAHRRDPRGGGRARA